MKFNNIYKVYFTYLYKERPQFDRFKGIETQCIIQDFVTKFKYLNSF